MLWTFSVHTAIYIKKGSVINAVCYERVCYEWGCYEHGLLWKWSVFNRSVMNGSVVNVVCFEWFVMNGLLWTGLFWMGTGLHRRILAGQVFLYCVKKKLHKSRYSLGHVDQSHTNNVFFKLVEALLQIYSCFFSRSINYTWLTAISSHCLAALHAKISVFNIHIQGSHSLISNKPRLHTKKTYS